MKYLRKFNEEVKEKSIEDWCNDLNIFNYEINDDTSVDVNNNVSIDSDMIKITKFPLKFNNIYGYFSCCHNKLKTLKGSPIKVGSYFQCFWNNITSIIDGPKEVGWDYSCGSNNLLSLVGSPKYITGKFECYDNKLTTLEGAPIEISSNFSCSYNKLTTLEGAPQKIGGHLICRDNKLISLEGCPLMEMGIIECNNNPIFQIYKLFLTHESYLESLDYGYLRGENISKRRLEKALEQSNINIVLPKSMKGYKYID
jgi:hypothetical protein